jgi:hypothetical protein
VRYVYLRGFLTRLYGKATKVMARGSWRWERELTVCGGEGPS